MSVGVTLAPSQTAIMELPTLEPVYWTRVPVGVGAHEHVILLRLLTQGGGEGAV